MNKKNNTDFLTAYIRGFYDSYEKAEEIGFVKGETAGKIIEKRNILQNLVEKQFTDEEIKDILVVKNMLLII